MLKLLILFPKALYDTKMSFGRRHVIEELLRRSVAGSIDAVLSGVGWPNYSPSASLAENINWLMPDCQAILWHKPLGNPSTKSDPLIQPRERASIPAICIYNEAWWPDGKAATECRESGTSLVIHHHLSDRGQFGSVPAVWIPHCADERLFGPRARHWVERDIPILVTGSLNSDTYPLRCRVARLINSRAIPGFVLDHPGYRLQGITRCEQQSRAYADFLGRSKIVVCCSSKYRYGLAKYVEAAMAGAAVAGDMPPDFEKTIWPHCLKLDCSDTDEQLIEKLSSAIADDSFLGLDALAGQTAANTHHSLAGYVNRLTGEIAKLAGKP